MRINNDQEKQIQITFISICKITTILLAMYRSIELLLEIMQQVIYINIMNLQRTELENNIMCYTFDGALDTLVEDQIRDLMHSDFEKGKVQFVLDLSKVEFIMSTIVGFFISFQKKLKKESGLLIILKPSSEVNLVFKVLGLNLMFEFSQDLDSALEKFNKIN